MSTKSPARNPEIHDVLIIGAGPCGLAVAARLRERTPSALFTDEEHRRFHWLQKRGGRSSIKNRRNGRIKVSGTPCCSHSAPSMVVLDDSGDRWMKKWHRQFAALNISHLRSPMFFHPNPRDIEALKSFAYAEGRSGELMEITGCVGQELSKHKKKKRTTCRRTMGTAEIDERNREDYFTPSTHLFRDFCDKTAKAYSLEDGLVQYETVQAVDYATSDCDDGPILAVTTDRTVHLARSVVVAVGSGSRPAIPAPFPSLPCQGAMHSAEILPRGIIQPSLEKRIRKGQPTNVLVIGGGLTSAQITEAVLAAGVSKVWQLVRGQLRVKHFDVDLQWMGKFKNGEKSAFWMADSDAERAQLLRDAIGGGSVTPRYRKVMKRHEDSGRLTLHTNTRAVSQHWCEESEQWHITTDPPIPSLPAFDYVYFATGMQKGLSTCPFLADFSSKFPVHVESGLPALTDDLMWRDDIPLFLTGKLASLRLGPDAGNLGGARAGAERVALAIQDLREITPESTSVSSVRDDETALRYIAGLGSRFESLYLGSDDGSGKRS